jgi:hypothetical protein
VNVPLGPKKAQETSLDFGLAGIQPRLMPSSWIVLNILRKQEGALDLGQHGSLVKPD